MTRQECKQESVYNLLKEDSKLTYEEIGDVLEMSPKTVSVHVHRLKQKGLISRDKDGDVIILKPYRENLDNPDKTLKAAIYEEMLRIYMDDFREQSTFSDRLDIGREIRLILEKV